MHPTAPRGPPGWPSRSSVALAGLAVVYWLALLLLRPLIAPYAVSLGGSTTVTAVIVSSQAAIAFVAALPVGSLADRKDARLVALTGSVLMAAAGVPLLLMPGWVGLITSQMPLGLGSLMVWLAIQNLMTRGPRRAGREVRIDTHTRHRQIVNYTIFVAIGQLGGPVLGGWIGETTTTRTVFSVYTWLCAIMVGLASWFPPLREATTTSVTRLSLREAFNAGARLAAHSGGRLLISSSFLSIWLIDLRISFLVLVLQDAGMSLSRAGLYLSFASALALASRPLLPVMLDRMGMPNTVAWCLLPGALSLAAVGLTDDPWVVLGLVVVHGLATGIAQPLTLSIVAEVVSEHRRGVGLAVRVMSNRAAQWTGPLLLGAMGTTLAVGPAFTASVALSAPLGLATAVRARAALQQPAWGKAPTTDDVDGTGV